MEEFLRALGLLDEGESLADLSGEDRAEKVAEAKKKLPAEVRSAVEDPAYKQGKKAGEKEAGAEDSETVTQLKKERDEARTERDEAQQKVEDLKGEADGAEEYQQEIKDLKEQHAEEVAELRGEIAGGKQDSFLGKVRTRVGPRLKDYYAESQVKGLLYDGRVSTDDDGNIVVQQAGKEIPIIAGSEDELADAVASEILSGAPSDVVISGADGGSGAGKGGGGKGSTNGDRQREAIKKKYGSEEDVEDKAEKLGI